MPADCLSEMGQETGRDGTGQDRTGRTGDGTGQDRTGDGSGRETGQDGTGDDGKRDGTLDGTGRDRGRTGQDRTGLNRTGRDGTGQEMMGNGTGRWTETRQSAGWTETGDGRGERRAGTGRNWADDTEGPGSRYEMERGHFSSMLWHYVFIADNLAMPLGSAYLFKFSLLFPRRR